MLGNFSDGISWFYKDFFKSKFIKFNTINASSVDDLKDKVKLNEDLWFIFDKQRVNKVNTCKEFFCITMDDVKQIVEENKGEVNSFVEKPEAEEYRNTLKIEKNELI